MTTEEQRIAFAEEMEWTEIEFYEDHQGPSFWSGRPPVKLDANWNVVKQRKRNLPDPFTNANDAEAIVEYMRGKGWESEMAADKVNYIFSFSKKRDGYRAHRDVFTGTGQNIRQAICAAFAAYIHSKQACA